MKKMLLRCLAILSLFLSGAFAAAQEKKAEPPKNEEHIVLTEGGQKFGVVVKDDYLECRVDAQATPKKNDLGIPIFKIMVINTSNSKTFPSEGIAGRFKTLKVVDDQGQEYEIKVVVRKPPVPTLKPGAWFGFSVEIVDKRDLKDLKKASEIRLVTGPDGDKPGWTFIVKQGK